MPFKKYYRTKIYRKLLISLGILLMPITVAFPASDLKDASESRKEAERILYLMVAAVNQIDKTFNEIPVDVNSKQWVISKLENMALIDQLIRRTLVGEVMTRNWPNSVKRAYINFFYNFDKPNTDEEYLGYAEKQDRYNYMYFIYLLESNEELNKYGWPFLSNYGQDAEYFAFLICQHGQPYDIDNWQTEHLIPQLKTLTKYGESEEVVNVWLSNPNPDFLKDIIPYLEKAGGPWADMIPEVHRLKNYFEAIPGLLASEKIKPLNPQP
jgi:hypothetical protein